MNTDTIILEVDGVVVENNENPALTPDVFIEKTMLFLEKNKNSFIVLITSRDIKHIKTIIFGIYNRIGKYPDRIMYNIPKGNIKLITSVEPHLLGE